MYQSILWPFLLELKYYTRVSLINIIIWYTAISVAYLISIQFIISFYSQF